MLPFVHTHTYSTDTNRDKRVQLNESDKLSLFPTEYKYVMRKEEGEEKITYVLLYFISATQKPCRYVEKGREYFNFNFYRFHQRILFLKEIGRREVGLL